MCCLTRKKRKVPAPRSHSHPPSSHGVPSSGPTNSSTFASSITDFSTSSTSSIASIKDRLPGGPVLYRFDDICLATGNFDPAKQVGHSVWRASLGNTLVAISRKQRQSGHFTSHRQFTSALRSVHALHHHNLVKLLGACCEGDYIFLVYEFMESSNLRDCLRSKFGVRFSALSSWLSRLRVALDIATGLEYLHRFSSPSLIHKHIDSRNILVGNDLRAKVAHVGVSVLTGEVEFRKTKLEDHPESLPQDDKGEIQPATSSTPRIARSRSIKITGVQGYMPPEYLNSGEVSSNYDIFTFGVVLAEILSGQEAVSSAHAEVSRRQVAKRVPLPDLLHSVMTGDDSKSKLRRWMDPLLKDSFPLDDAYKVALIAKACMDPDPINRPDMTEVRLRLQKLLDSAEKYDATIRVQRELMTESLQPR